MTIEEKVSNLKNRIWKFFQKYPHIKEIKDENIPCEYTKLQNARILMSTKDFFIAGIIVGFSWVCCRSVLMEVVNSMVTVCILAKQ